MLLFNLLMNLGKSSSSSKYDLTLAVLILFLAIEAIVAFFFNQIIHKPLVEIIFVVVSFEMGHVILTYFMLLSNAELKQKFPWIIFFILNIVVYFVFHFLLKELIYQRSIYFWVPYNGLRIIHSIQQRTGLSGLMLNNNSPRKEELFSTIKKTSLAGKIAALGGLLMKAFLVPGRLILLVIASLLYLKTIFDVQSKTKDKKEKLSIVLFSHFFVLPFAGQSFGSIVRLFHSYEYILVFKRFFNSKDGKGSLFFKAGLISMITLTGIHFIYSLNKTSSPYAVTTSNIFFTLATTHMIQDWYIFNYNKQIAGKMRAILSAHSTF